VTTPPTVPQIFAAALRLGCTSFGGPIAHLAYFRRDYVERRGWLSDQDYAELVALCQFLPGPASSQAGFGIGYRLQGWAGGLAAWVGFTLPSAVLMIGFALGLSRLDDLASSGWLHGLKLAAIAVVAHAVIAMWRALAPDAVRSAFVVVGAAALLAWPQAWVQVAVLALGAGAGWLALRRDRATAAKSAVEIGSAPGSLRASVLLFAGFLVPLLMLPVLAREATVWPLHLADTFYRTGALVFGGGHTVLPLLERELVVPGGITPDQFLAGYGAAQAMPGPLFTFAGYLGAVQHGVAGGVWALAWIFLPGLLLVPVALPVWNRLRQQAAMQAALRGANATVVGLLLAALLPPLGTVAGRDWLSALLTLAGFALLHVPRVPAWAVVLACAAAGAMLA
jgi:chromate transporter